ncbi:MAG: hypothetical protein A7315_11895 [Candidatus Altiarchaeales archaeon WOR_SM1_79]|nr:MAG: hypothetical protein A7315_11895 [Candidatus Altiarchaeales archaeon WOR_SM1_79]
MPKNSTKIREKLSKNKANLSNLKKSSDNCVFARSCIQIINIGLIKFAVGIRKNFNFTSKKGLYEYGNKYGKKIPEKPYIFDFLAIFHNCDTMENLRVT